MTYEMKISEAREDGKADGRMEMAVEMVTSRILANAATINSRDIKSGNMTKQELAKLESQIEAMKNLNIHFSDESLVNISDIRTMCRKLYQKHGLSLVVIDYLQLVQASNRAGGSREQEISEISRSLKILAKELNVPVIALSQLSREADKRQDHRPVLSDLRESEAIEQDADIVMFIYRDDYYNNQESPTNIAEIIMAKNRSGPVGTTNLLWMPQYTKFENIYNGAENG